MAFTRAEHPMSKAKYPHSRYVRNGGLVKPGMFAGATRPVRNILRLFWPRFPANGPTITRGVRQLSAKKHRRAVYWTRIDERRFDKG